MTSSTGLGPTEATPAPGVSSPEDVLACLLELTHGINAADDLGAGLARMAKTLRRFVPFDSFAVLLLDDLGRELRFAHAEGFPVEVIEHWRFGMGQGIVGTVAQQGEPVLIGNVGEDDRFIDGGNDARCELAVPLLVKNRVIGVLDVTCRTPEGLGAHHLDLLSSLAGALASAIDHARLFQNSRDQARSLSLLQEVSRELNTILDQQQLLARVAQSVRRLVDYDVFSVLLLNEEHGALEPWISIGRDDRDLEWRERLELGHGIVGTVAALRQPLRVPNVRMDPRYMECRTGIDVISELAVPMVHENRLIGVIDLESASYDAFSAQHEQLLATLAATVAIALENARLYQQVRAGERRLDAELAMAREIQRQLLPTSTPWRSGLQIGYAYRPARHLGGDFYDFFSATEGTVGIAVGDVAGKATPAALYGSLAIGTLRELAAQGGHDPESVLCHLNGKLHQLGIGNRFLALVLASYDEHTGRLRLANSGLPYPYLLRAGRVEQLAAAGVPLGLLPDRSYEAVELELHSGDALIVATDGIEESLDADFHELGRAAIDRALAGLPPEASAREIAAAIADLADAHSAAAEPSDDRTVVVLKVTTD